MSYPSTSPNKMARTLLETIHSLIVTKHAPRFLRVQRHMDGDRARRASRQPFTPSRLIQGGFHCLGMSTLVVFQAVSRCNSWEKYTGTLFTCRGQTLGWTKFIIHSKL
ncbi:hypothetical protein BDV28DRAFT_133083 [Aspergillus coremiiformis]|uniref:Uncharacterized protein n=1 Tax=Aspergillus coremiiformis TaxID=138285 RepID=A0A5N6Z9R8_9EURO|nr:hypothetical protein BDV28DRAFT_133083 [Aspergillus coremiiformis]